MTHTTLPSKLQDDRCSFYLGIVHEASHLLAGPSTPHERDDQARALRSFFAVCMRASLIAGGQVNEHMTNLLETAEEMIGDRASEHRKNFASDLQAFIIAARDELGLGDKFRPVNIPGTYLD